MSSSPEGPFDHLTMEDLLDITSAVVGNLQVRDLGLLASAAARPLATAFGQDAYPGFPERAAALMHSLARNHSLLDGNKRLAWSATRVFCLMNGRDLAPSVDEAEALVLGVAAGELDVPDIAATLAQHLACARPETLTS